MLLLRVHALSFEGVLTFSPDFGVGVVRAAPGTERLGT